MAKTDDYLKNSHPLSEKDNSFNINILLSHMSKDYFHIYLQKINVQCLTQNRDASSCMDHKISHVVSYFFGIFNNRHHNISFKSFLLKKTVMTSELCMLKLYEKKNQF